MGRDSCGNECASSICKNIKGNKLENGRPSATPGSDVSEQLI